MVKAEMKTCTSAQGLGEGGERRRLNGYSHTPYRPTARKTALNMANHAVETGGHFSSHSGRVFHPSESDDCCPFEFDVFDSRSQGEPPGDVDRSQEMPNGKITFK